MAHKQYRVPCSAELPIASLAPLLKTRVADRKDLVQNQNLANSLERDGIGQSRAHPTRIMLQTEIGKPFQLCEREDLVDCRADLPKRQAHHGADEKDVV